MKLSPLALVLALVCATVSSGQTIVLDTFDLVGGTGTVKPSTSWEIPGNVTQNANSITVGSIARDDNGWYATGLSLDSTGMSYLNVTAHRDSGNVAASLVIGFLDPQLDPQTFSIPSSSFQTGISTTIQIPIGSWPLNFDFTHIFEWSIGGGNPSPGVSFFKMTLENLEFSATPIPEPSTAALIFGISATGLVVLRRRFKRAV